MSRIKKVKLEGLYGLECFILNKKRETQEFEKKERKILSKILRPQKTAENEKQLIRDHGGKKVLQWGFQWNINAERRLQFYGCLVRMNKTLLAKYTFEYVVGLKSTTTWMEWYRSGWNHSGYGLHTRGFQDPHQLQKI